MATEGPLAGGTHRLHDPALPEFPTLADANHPGTLSKTHPTRLASSAFAHIAMEKRVLVGGPSS